MRAGPGPPAELPLDVVERRSPSPAASLGAGPEPPTSPPEVTPAVTGENPWHRRTGSSEPTPTDARRHPDGLLIAEIPARKAGRPDSMALPPAPQQLCSGTLWSQGRLRGAPSVLLRVSSRTLYSWTFSL